jgi:[protein-PII] uridylyltransferase
MVIRRAMHPVAPELLAERTAKSDSIVQETSTKYLSGKIKTPFSVLAVGGYGRAELFPQSDVDLLILIEQETDLDGMKEPLALFLRELWDAGLRASQSVRTVSDCTHLQEHNIELHISLLDARLVCGNPAPFAALSHALPDFYRKQETRITRDLADMARKRHSKFNDTVYHLEPNIKEAPGGMRDLHFLHWLALLAQEKGAIREALRDIEDSKQFLYSVRCFLHERSHRDNNLLSFELQDRAAEAWAESWDTPVDPGEWMRVYYRHARRIFHSTLKALEFAEIRASPLVRQFRDWRGRLSTSEYTVSQERVLLRNPAATMSSAASVLELFTFIARHGVHLSWDAHRRLTGNGEALAAKLRTEKIPWPAWRDFFAQPHVALALREMQETGLLAAAIPHWASVECLVVRDFYHRYTVDEHSVVAIEVIDRLAAGNTDLPLRMRNLLQEEDQVPVLRLALLLHDVGKGTLPGDHVLGSLNVSTEVFERLSVPKTCQDMILFLIDHHLDLSMVMTGRDLDDPATARFLTSRIGTPEDLRRLALLTFADISAVNPTAMTPWRMEQLWRVYLSAQEQLTRELIADRIDQDSSAWLTGDESAELMDFLRGFPTRYLRTHTRQQIQHHFEMDRKRPRDGVSVEVTQDSGSYLLTVVARDSPGRFAQLCGTLASCGMNILKAEAASNSNGSILDLIRFADPMRTLELNPDEVLTLERTIRSVLDGSLKVTDLLKRRRATPRPSSGAKISPVFRFNNEASDQCTLIDFVGEDRPGLLYDLTSVISAAECNIELVLVDTEAHKAMDVFYVTRAAGKLDHATQASLGAALSKAAAVN